MSSTITALTTSGGLAMAGDTSGQLELKTNNGTTAVTIDTAQNVGIGTTTPAALGNSLTELTVKATTADKYANLNLIGVRDVGGNQNGLVNFWNNYGTLTRTAYIGGTNTASSNTSGELFFVTANAGTLAERMRIDSSGNLRIGTTTDNDTRTAIYWTQGTPTWGCKYLANNSGATNFIEFRLNMGSSPTTVGGITSNGTTTSYVTSSDYRLKEDIAPMTGALDKVSALKPCTYKWKANGETSEGFIAHELAEVCPEAVSGVKDGVDEEGNPKYQGIDTSFLVATLTAAIQELKAELDSVKTELATLKA